MFAAGKTATVSGAAPDDKFNYVTMLLHGDGTNGAQNNTFLDSSTNNFTITRNGNTTQGSFSPYGSNWSNLFNGTNDFLVSRNATKQDSAFTFECWVYTNPSAYSGDQILIANAATNYAKLGINTSGQLFIDVSNVGVLVTSSTSLNNNNWNHIAMVRSGTSAFIYLNGVRVASATKSTWVAGSASPGTYLAAGDTGGGSYDGYISNIRFVYGTALYTNSTYTVPTSSLTAISGTSLLTCQSNRFIDNSSNAYALTVSGTPSVQRFNPFGTATAYSTSVIGGSGYFDGTTDYLTVSQQTALSFGTGDFSIEAWVYPQATIGFFGVIDARNSGAGSGNQPWIFGLSDRTGYKVELFLSDAARYYGSITVPLNCWTHIAVSRVSGTLKSFVNGVVDYNASMTSAVNANGTTQSIGRIYDPAYTTGYITDVRVVKGSGYSSLTVPTAPLTAITNTQLLLNTTNGAIFDNAMINNLETVGNAQISTSVKKYGTGSLAFDGTGDYLKIPSTPNFAFGTGDFTIEFWWYPLSSALQEAAFFTVGNAISSANAMSVFTDSSRGLLVFSNNSYIVSGYGSDPTLNAWNHMAVTRTSGTLRTFVNGTFKQSASFTNTINAAISYVGFLDSTAPYSPNGYIDDMRITRGYSRYPTSTNFTAPTSAFSDTGPY